MKDYCRDVGSGVATLGHGGARAPLRNEKKEEKEGERKRERRKKEKVFRNIDNSKL